MGEQRAGTTAFVNQARLKLAQSLFHCDDGHTTHDTTQRRKTWYPTFFRLQCCFQFVSVALHPTVDVKQRLFSAHQGRADHNQQKQPLESLPTRISWILYLGQRLSQCDIVHFAHRLLSFLVCPQGIE